MFITANVCYIALYQLLM